MRSTASQRMRHGRCGVIALALVTAAITIAQPAMARSGIYLARPANSGMANAYRASMLGYAKCFVDSKPARVTRLIALSPTSREAQEEFRTLSFTSHCNLSLPSRLAFSLSMFRGAAYEVLYRTSYGEEGVSNFSAVPSVNYRTGFDETADTDRQEIALLQFADCLIRSNPATAHQLLITYPGSKSENAAFDALTPNMSGCLPKDRTIRFSKTVLRGTVAEALYRLRVSAGQEG